MIYLARIPKHYGGYLLGLGLSLILVMQERDALSFKFALVPIIFNNMLLILSQCLMGGPGYVNSRMVAFGTIWYLLSVISFIG